MSIENAMIEKEAIQAAYGQTGIEFKKAGKPARCTFHKPDKEPSAVLKQSKKSGRWYITCYGAGCVLNDEPYFLDIQGLESLWDELAIEINQTALECAINNIAWSGNLEAYRAGWGLPRERLICDDGTLPLHMIAAGVDDEDLKKYHFINERGDSLTDGAVGYVYYEKIGDKFLPIATKWRRTWASKKDRRFHTTGAAGPMLFYAPGNLVFTAEAKELFILGGEKDCLVAHKLGFPAIGLPSEGATPSEAVAAIAHDKEVTVWMDADGPGRRAAVKYAQGLADILERPVHVVDWKMGPWGKDLADWHRRYPDWDKEDLEEALEDFTKVIEPTWRELGKQAVTKTLSDADRSYRETADAVIAALDMTGKFLRDLGHNAYYFDEKNKELFRLEEGGDTRLLAGFGLNPTERRYRFCMAELASHALHYGEKTQVHLMWARTADAYMVYNNAGMVWKITAEEIKLVPNGTDGVLFSPLPESYEEITRAEPSKEAWDELIGLLDEENAAKLAAFIRGMPSGRRLRKAAPFINIVGPTDAGKSGGLRIIGMFWWGRYWEVMTAEDTAEYFVIQLDKSPIIAWDNADTWYKWSPDFIAQVGTGGVYKKRKYYTTADTHDVEILCYLGITSRTPHYKRPDVANRALTLMLPDEPGGIEGRLGDEEFLEYILDRRLGAMWWLFHQLQEQLKSGCVLDADQKKELRRYFRMGSWAEEVISIAVNSGDGTVDDWMEVFSKHSSIASEFALSRWRWYEALKLWLERGEGRSWMRPGEIVDELNKIEVGRVGGPINVMKADKSEVELDGSTLGNNFQGKECRQALEKWAGMETHYDKAQKAYVYRFCPIWGDEEADFETDPPNTLQEEIDLTEGSEGYPLKRV